MNVGRIRLGFLNCFFPKCVRLLCESCPTVHIALLYPRLSFLRNSMRADTLSTSNIKNRIGNKLPAEKFADVRHLLDEKRQHTRPRPAGSSTNTGIVVRLCSWALS